MRLFIFELKKILLGKRFSYTMLLLFAFIIGLYFRNVAFQDLVLEEQERGVIEYTQEAQSMLRALNQSPENAEIKERINHLATALNALYEWKPLIKSDDWQMRLQKENAFLTSMISYKEANGEFSIKSKEMQQTLAFNERLLSQGIQPNSENYSIALPNFMKGITDLFVNVGALLILLLLVGDMISMEYEQGSIRLLYTLPIKKSSILHAKWASAVVTYLLVTVSIYVMTWIAGTLIGTTGTFSYPVFMENEKGISFISIAEYMQWSLLCTTSIVLFVFSLCLLISLFVKNSIVTLLIQAIILIGGFFTLQAMPIPAKSWVDPFQFVFAGITVQQVGADWYQGVPIIILLTVIFYMFSLVKINKSSGF
ncbi:ABC transporter permease [Lysinibacillus sp. 54212]|uniref:ABC transporter permease n=1 Tax=Lysinibacillus sp. 54212 TaxID=3119829 RepID=UPI002FC718C6